MAFNTSHGAGLFGGMYRPHNLHDTVLRNPDGKVTHYTLIKVVPNFV